MYQALRCSFSDTEATAEWIRDLVGGPDDEFHVSAPSYPRLRRLGPDEVRMTQRHLLPGLIFVRQWTVEQISENMGRSPDQYLRWLHDPSSGDQIRFTCPESDISDLEDHASSLVGAPEEIHDWWAADGDRTMVVGPFKGRRMDIQSQHKNGFIEPFYMVRVPFLRSTLKVDGAILGTM